jgi:hypothetical protein
MRFGIVFIIVMLTVGCVSGQSALELAGNWHGNGKITTTWCEQDTLHFDFTISTDDEISGRIGDAVIISGVTEKDRGQGEFTYIITIKLKGSLIECQDIKRSRIVLIVNRNENLVTGNFYTEGSMFGRKSDGSIIGTSLLLYYK